MTPDNTTAPWPTHVSVSLTDVCQLRCATCSHSYEDPSIFRHTAVPPDRIKHFLRHAKVACVHGLGEVLMLPTFWDIVPNHIPEDCHFGWATTGHALTPEHIERIVQRGVKFLSISFLGGPETYRKFHGASWSHVWARIDALLDCRSGKQYPQLIATYMVMQSNMHEIHEVVRMCGKRGFQDVRLFHMNRVSSWPGDGRWADGSMGFNYLHEQEISERDEAPHVMRALRAAGEYGMPVLGIGRFLGSRWNHEDMRIAMV